MCSNTTSTLSSSSSSSDAENERFSDEEGFFKHDIIEDGISIFEPPLNVPGVKFTKKKADKIDQYLQSKLEFIHGRNKKAKKRTKGRQRDRDIKRGVRKGATPFVRLVFTKPLKSFNKLYKEQQARQSHVMKMKLRAIRVHEGLRLRVIIRQEPPHSSNIDCVNTEAKRLRENLNRIQEERRSTIPNQKLVEHRLKYEEFIKQHEQIKMEAKDERRARRENIAREAREHFETLLEIESAEEKAIYLNKVLRRTGDITKTTKEQSEVKEDEEEGKIHKEDNKENDNEIDTRDEKINETDVQGSEKNEVEKDNEKEKEYEREVVRGILSHFQTSELESIIETLGKYASVKEDILTEEVLLQSFTRTLNSAKKILLSGDHETKLSTSLAVKAFDSIGYAQDYMIVSPLDASERRHPIIPFDANVFTKELKYGALSIVPTQEVFNFVFDIFTKQFFRGVNLAGGIFAGGAVTACLQPLKPFAVRSIVRFNKLRRVVSKLPLPPYIVDHILSFLPDADLKTVRKNLQADLDALHRSDVDIFIIADTLEEAENKMKVIVKNVKRRFKQLRAEFVITRTANAITFYSEKYRYIQIIVSVLRSLDDFLLFCDLDCTSCVFDGRDVYLSQRSVRAFNKRYNLLAPSALNSQITRGRILKYLKRGYSTMVFDPNKLSYRNDMTHERDSYNKLVSSRSYRERKADKFGEYGDDRPYFRPSGIELKEMSIYFLTKNIPYGTRLKDVWKRDKENKKERERGKERQRESEEENDAAEEEIEKVEEEREETERGVPEMRWKWQDSLRSRDFDHLLPRCYMCKQRSIPCFLPGQVGLALCSECVALNKRMMDQWDDLQDLDENVALVTGARIKIGYHIALRLLRSGCTVIAVTRFPNDAALRYSLEPDFYTWKHKLHIYGVDLRHLPSVGEFIQHVQKNYERIDMLINNAAQTKRRPRAYYYEVIQRERKLMADERCNWLVKDFSSSPFFLREDVSSNVVVANKKNENSEMAELRMFGNIALDSSLPTSAALTQVQLHPMDKDERNDKLFPPGQVDEHNEPLDMRAKTSWNQKIDEIDTVELMEVQIVNSTVPFMLISSFNPLLKAAALMSLNQRAFVVNVTAVEGMFSYNKRNGGHPHTNMAKAALNMLTKTIGDTFAKSNIFVTAVDTGWCTEMRYVPVHKRDSRGVPLVPVPLTDKDGAARVLYPIYVGLTSSSPPHGVLYHDYQVEPWD